MAGTDPEESRLIKNIELMGATRSILVSSLCGCLAICQPFHAAPAMAQSQGTKVAEQINQREVNALGTKLIHIFYTYLAATGSPTGSIGKPAVDDLAAKERVRTLLDPNVIVQRADGDFFNYGSYEPVDIDEFVITDVNITKPRPDLLVATYRISTPGASSLQRGFVNSGDFMPRLTTFRYNADAKRWLILSHAAFNKPIAQICNHPLIASTSIPKQNRDDSANLALANELIESLYSDVRNHNEATVHQGGLITQQSQIVSGDGHARTGASKARKIKVGSTQRRGIFVTRSGDDLVVRFEAKNKSQIGGIDFTNEWQPRLATFSKDGRGQWKLASFALFNYPESPPPEAACIKERR